MKREAIKRLILLFMLTTLPLMGFAETSKDMVQKRKSSGLSFFSPGSFFVYVLGTHCNFDPPAKYYLDLGGRSVNSFVPMIGLGYRILNSRDNFYLNLSFDYMPAKFDFPHSFNQKANIYTLLLDAEGVFFRDFPISIYFGLGVSIINLDDLGYFDAWDKWVLVGDDSVTAMAIELGMKYTISKNFLIRASLRFIGEIDITNHEYWDEYWDDYFYDNNGILNRLNTSLGVGIEFHL
jgi:hypothetical protein